MHTISLTSFCPALRRIAKIARMAGVCLFVWTGSVWCGLSADTNTVASTEQIARLQSRLTEARSLLARAQVELIDAEHLPSGATPAEAEEYRLQAEILVRIYWANIEELRELEEIRRQTADLAREIEDWKGFPEPPPYSILRADELRDSVQSLELKIATAEKSQELLSALISDETTNLKTRDAHLRLLDEQMETVKEVVRTERLMWQKRLETLRGRRSEATLALDEARRRTALAGMDRDRRELAFVLRKLATVNAHLRFSQTDLDQMLLQVDEERRGVDKELSEAGQEFLQRQSDLETARSALAHGAPEHADILRLQMQVALCTERLETSSQRQAMLRQIAEIYVFERGMWQVRFSSFRTKDLDEIRVGYLQLEKLKRLIDSVRPLFQQKIELADKLASGQDNRMSNERGGDSAVSEALLSTYRQRGDYAKRALQNLDRIKRLAMRWNEALDNDRRNLPLVTRARDLFGGFSSFFSKIWTFELFAVQQTVTVDGQAVTGSRSVTVGKVMSAVLILVLGCWFSSLVARVLEKWILRRTHMEWGRAELIRRWTRIAFIAVLVVISLILVKIPLTVFAFAGGALAIGVGFGTQNLIKNFISGIIILFERPFRIGDVLDIDGHRGIVTGIGIRSSVVRFWNNTETLIPNSTLLENNLTNWTYSARTVRFSVAVGVAYGSDTRLVGKLLAEAAERHDLVQKTPKPQVLFVDFADSNLMFEVRFWVDVSQHDPAAISSDLRHIIAASFAAHDVVMAYPQRDVHFDCEHPVPVHMVDGDSEGSIPGS